LLCVKGYTVNTQLIVILVGFFYILIFGGLALLRREGLSGQFALEALAIIILAVLAGWATGTVIHPILLYVVLYLITMRARVLTDLANLLFRRQGYARAEHLYRLALCLLPDRASRFIVLVNQGIAQLQSGDGTAAITTLGGVLTSAKEGGGLGHKYEAACRYNLAIAYRKAGDDAKAVQQFNQVVELFPASIYGQAAEKALKERRERGFSDKNP
jgi:tetratricopeptide (TPR) repeat protein